MSTWKQCSLGDFVALQRGHDLTESERRVGCVPVMGSAGQNGFHDTARAKGPGIVIGRSGASFGQVHYSADDFWPHNTALYVTDFKGNDERFAFYFLKAIDFSRYNSGSAQQSLNRNYIYPIPVRVPPLPEQKAIAAVLGALDDKIELNRRMNATLEAMARALFQSWFVDFDPVRAKKEGRPTAGIDEATAALFPAQFQDSEIGEIPHGWTVGALGDVAKNPRRGVNADRINEATAYIGLEHMPRRCIALSEWDTAEGLESNKSEFKRGELLYGKLRPYFHKVGVAPLDGVCSTDILVISPAEPHWFGFALGHVSSLELVNHTDAMSTGTKMPRTKWQDIAGFEVVLPPREVAAAFTALVEPLVQQILVNIHLSHTLAVLRDTLLPKLLNGELRLDENGKPRAQEALIRARSTITTLT